MSDPTPSLDGAVQFRQHEQPALIDGNYSIEIDQTIVLSDGTRNPYTHGRSFSVTGPRFSLPTDSVVSVFPPEGARGEFDNALPQAVFSKPTLPWQRSIYDSAPTYASGADVPPWLALILIDEEDAAPAVNDSATVQQLLMPETGIFCPTPILETGQATTDPCVTLDLSLDFFNQVAPTIDDLNLMGHTRELTLVSSKPAENAVSPNTEFSVIFGNRLPKMGNLTTVHLVSLEGFSDYLPTSGGTASTQFPSGTDTVRLVSLKSWSFTAIDENQTFTGLLENLDVGALQMPLIADGNQTVTNAFAMGFTAMNHSLRDGDATVSWYRGPLLPMANESEIILPAACADALLQYDSATGMFDVSLAAAWQLGRLLALQNRSIAVSLYAWKAKQTVAEVVASELQILTQQLPEILLPNNAANLKAESRVAGRDLSLRLATNVLGKALQHLDQPPPKNKK